jgi:NAD(P)-dependent dehydrogenase (short-subunit alcohol dehydrogenase family)
VSEASNPFDVAGRNVLVVGGTRGIGRAIALQFARAGARVLANYVRSEDSARSLQEAAAAESLQVETLRADVSMDKGREELVAQAAQRCAPLHAIVYAAATGVHKDLDTVSARHFDFVVALNVRAYLLLVQSLLPVMTEGGAVIALSSEGAERVMPHYGLVSTTKAALEALTRQWAVELAPRGIRANVLAPGAIATDAWKVLPGGQERLDAAAAKTPRGTLVTVEEVAHVAQFLASGAAAGISGQTIIVDGGARVLGSG